MTNDNTNQIIDAVQTMLDFKKQGLVSDVRFKLNMETNIFDIYVIPKQTVQYIKCDFVITPTGCTFQ